MAFIPAQANGNIHPCRFVSMDASNQPTTDFKVIEDIIVAAPIAGIAQEGSDWPPLNDAHVTVAGYAAIAGEAVKVFADGEICLLEIASAVVAGQLLKTNGTTDGRGIPVDISSSTTTAQQYGAMALHSGGTAGEKVKVIVKTGVYTYHA
jgi:hypothetical protein